MPLYTLRYIANDVQNFALTSTNRFAPSNPKELEAKGELHGLITVIGSEGIQADRVAKFVWDAIVDSYFYSPFTTVIDSLKHSVAVGARKASDLIKNQPELDSKGVNLSFALAVFKGKGAYLTVFGEQQLLLYKNGGFVKVDQIVNQNKGVVLSMAWSDSDLLIMSSPGLIDQITSDKKLGDSADDIAKGIDKLSAYLRGCESLLLLSGKEFKVIKRPPIEPLVRKERVEVKLGEKKVEEETPVEMISKDELPTREELVDEIVEESVVPDKKLNFNFGRHISRVQVILKSALVKVIPGITKIGEVTTNIVNRLSIVGGGIVARVNGLIREKYGRQNWFKNLMARLSLLSFGKKQMTQGLKIDGYKEVGLRNKRFGIFFLALLVIFLIYGGARLSIAAKQSRDLHKQAVEIFDSMEEVLNEAEKTYLTSSEDAELILFNNDGLLIPLEGKTLSLEDQVRMNSLKTRLQAIEDKIAKKVGVSEEDGTLEFVLDGRTQFGDAVNLTDITSYKDEFQNEFLFISNAGGPEVYKMSLTDNKAVPLDDSKNILKQPKYVDYGEGGVYVFDEQAGMVRAPFGKDGSIGRFGILSGLDRDVIGGMTVVDMAIITNIDNVYLLSSSEKAVMKSGRTGAGYSYPFEYVSGKSFDSAHNLANDISLYVMTSGDRGIERYSFDYTRNKTVLNAVTVEDVEGLGELLAAYTVTREGARMYVFDKTGERVLVFEKPVESGGEILHPNQMRLLAQYVYRGARNDMLKDVREIAADYNEESLYILDGNRILKLKLK